jgi:CobQ-like glutamine amidotransferase family enzyme
MSQRTVSILHLYPREMNIYGDRGNILTLVQRLKWRGFGAEVVEAGIGDEVDVPEADIVFGGGGQDRGQIAVGIDLQRHAQSLHDACIRCVPMLTICGTYQLFGHGFTTLEGQEIPGISLFKAQTVGSTQRMIGNEIVDTDFGRLVGFENHSGRTLLDAGQAPLGKVVQGFGNDGQSGYEGARLHNAFGAYLHGPVLPKNPAFADFLILQALKNKYGVSELEPLDDSVEQAAAKSAMNRPQ